MTTPHPTNPHRRDRKILVTNPGAELYGADRVMLETVSALSDAGARVTVAMPEAGPLVEHVEDRGGRILIVPTAIIRKSALRPVGFLKLVKDALTGVWPAVRVIRHERPEVVVVNTIVSPLWLIAAKVTGTPVISHVHEAETSGSAVVRRALTLPQFLADQLIVNSEFSRNTVVSTWRHLASRSVVVYNAVAGPSHVTPPRSTLSGPIRLLYVGRLSPRKGPDVAIDALRVLIERGIDAELDIVGAVFKGYEWFEHDLREKVIEGDLQTRVRFHGFQEDIWPFVERADINIVPSTVDEPFGNTAVEAALAGRPLIVSATSGLLEASADLRARIGVPRKSPVAIADAVETIRNRWQEFATHAIDDTEATTNRYSVDRYSQDIWGVINRVTASRHSGHVSRVAVRRGRPAARP
jgi:glycosyltransferase involved in cell wall biosynthesis